MAYLATVANKLLEFSIQIEASGPRELVPHKTLLVYLFNISERQRNMASVSGFNSINH